VRGSSQYRKILVRSLLGKFFFEFADFQERNDQQSVAKIEEIQ
jgi:xanthine dehydrogenase iron-sulfur cluster and FAD-binding subunit A